MRSFKYLAFILCTVSGIAMAHTYGNSLTLNAHASLSFIQPVLSGLHSVNAVQSAKDTIRAEGSELISTEQEHSDNQLSLVKTYHKEIVSSFPLMAAVRQLNPADLNLSVDSHNQKDYYESVKNRWIGYGIE